MSSADIILVTILVVLAVLSLGLLVGAMGLLIQHRDRRAQSDLGIREVFGFLDQRWHLERWFYRHHRVFGAIITATAAFCAWQLLALIPTSGQGMGWAWLLPTVLAAQSFNAGIGIVVMVRPSALKSFEASANRWHSPRFGGNGSPSPGRIAVLMAAVALVTLLTVAALILRTLAAWSP